MADLTADQHRLRLQTLERLLADPELDPDTKRIYREEAARARLSLETELADTSPTPGSPAGNRLTANLLAGGLPPIESLAPQQGLPDISLVAPVEADTQLVKGPRGLGRGAPRFGPLALSEAEMVARGKFSPEEMQARGFGTPAERGARQQEQALKLAGSVTKGLFHAGTRGFGEPALRIGSRMLGPIEGGRTPGGTPMEATIADIYDAIPAYPLIEAIGGFYGTIMGIGGFANISRFTTSAAATSLNNSWLKRLAGQAAGGKFSPRLSQFVQLGIGGVVNQSLHQLLAEAYMPGDQPFDVLGAGLAGLEAGVGGAVGVPRGMQQLKKGVLEFGKLSQAWRSVAIGIPLTGLYQKLGRERVPFFAITGIPLVDNAIFDFGLQALLSPRPGRVGNVIPVLTSVAGKPAKVMNATILDMHRTSDGGRAYTLQLENGRIVPYRIGEGFQLDMPEPVTINKIQGADPRIRQGSLVVHHPRKGTPRLGVFKYRGGETFEVGWLTQRGQQPVMWDSFDVKDIRNLRVISDPAALDALLPPGVKLDNWWELEGRGFGEAAKAAFADGVEPARVENDIPEEERGITFDKNPDGSFTVRGWHGTYHQTGDVVRHGRPFNIWAGAFTGGQERLPFQLHMGTARAAAQRLEALKGRLIHLGGQPRGYLGTDAAGEYHGEAPLKLQQPGPGRPKLPVLPDRLYPIEVTIRNPVGTPENPVPDQGHMYDPVQVAAWRKAGHDAVIYLNDGEDPGSISVALLDPNAPQIKGQPTLPGTSKAAVPEARDKFAASKQLLARKLIKKHFEISEEDGGWVDSFSGESWSIDTLVRYLINADENLNVGFLGAEDYEGMPRQFHSALKEYTEGVEASDLRKKVVSTDRLRKMAETVFKQHGIEAPNFLHQADLVQLFIEDGWAGIADALKAQGDLTVNAVEDKVHAAMQSMDALTEEYLKSAPTKGAAAEPAPEKGRPIFNLGPGRKGIGIRFTYRRPEEGANDKLVKDFTNVVAEIIGKLPEPYQGLVKTVTFYHGGSEVSSRASYNYKTRTMWVNLDRIAEQGILLPGARARYGFRPNQLQNLTKTILHEFAHAATRDLTMQQRQTMYRALGWVPIEELSAGGEQLVVSTRRPSGGAYSEDDAAAYSGELRGPSGNRKYAIADDTVDEKRWARPLTPQEALQDSVLHERRSPSEDVAHGVDQLLWSPDVFYAREPERFTALTTGLAGRLAEVSGFTQRVVPPEGLQLSLFPEAIAPPPATALPKAKELAATETPKTIVEMVTNAIFGKERGLEHEIDATTKQQMLEHVKSGRATMDELGGIAQRLGQSGRGTREELTKRIIQTLRKQSARGTEHDIDPYRLTTTRERLKPASKTTLAKIRNMIGARADLPFTTRMLPISDIEPTSRAFIAEHTPGGITDEQMFAVQGLELTHPDTGQTDTVSLLISSEQQALEVLRLLRQPVRTAEERAALSKALVDTDLMEAIQGRFGASEESRPIQRGTEVEEESPIDRAIRGYNDLAAAVEADVKRAMDDPKLAPLVEALHGQLEFTENLIRKAGFNPDNLPVEGANTPAGMALHMSAMASAIKSAEGKPLNLKTAITTYRRRAGDRLKNLQDAARGMAKLGVGSPLFDEAARPKPAIGKEGGEIKGDVEAPPGAPEMAEETEFDTGVPAAEAPTERASGPTFDYTPTGAAATSGPSAPRRPRGIIHKLFKTLVGIEAKREQFVRELAGMNPQQRYAITEFFGVDSQGRPVKEPKSLDAVARSMNMYPDEVGIMFRGLIRRADGELYQMKSRTRKEPATRELPGGQRVFGFVTGKQFQEQYNQEQSLLADPVRLAQVRALEDQRSAVLQAQRQLRAAPDNPALQRSFREALDKLARLETPEVSTTTPEQIGDQPALSFPPDPPPVKIAPWLRQLNDKNLLKNWRKAAIAAQEHPGDAPIQEKLSQLVAEMRRRNLVIPDTPFPAPGRKGGSSKPPKQRNPGAPRTEPPPPSGGDTSKQGDYNIRIIDDLEAVGIEKALEKRDVRPRLVIVEDATTGEVLGTWRTYKLKPDFAANPKYAVKYFGYLDKAGRPTTDRQKGMHWYTITDLKAKEDIGNFTLSGVQKIIGAELRPFVDVDPRTGTLAPSAEEVGLASQDTIAMRLGSRLVSRGEYANLTGEEQFVHTRNLIMTQETADAAWRVYNEFLNVYGIKDYDGFPDDMNTMLNEMMTKFGAPDTAKLHTSLPVDAINKIKKNRDTILNAAVREYADSYPKDLGGTGAAYDHRITTEAYYNLINLVADPDKIPVDPQVLEGGFLTLGARHYGPVVRQMLLWGHPIMADAYNKARGADAQHGILLRTWKQKYDKIVEGLTKPEKIAISLLMDGRYEASQSVKMAKRSLISNDAFFVNIRRGIQTAWHILSGHPATKQMMVADASPELVAKAAEMRRLTNDIAEMMGLEPNLFLEEYFPHVFRMRGRLIDFPIDMNVGREVYFRFAQARKTSASDYELDLDQVMDIYFRGAARRISYTPLLEEFSSKKVQSLMPKAQRDYLNRWMRFIVGDPDPADASISKQLEALNISSAPGGLTTLLRRFMYGPGSERPFTRTAAALRGWQFAAKIDYNWVTGLVNMSQSWLTLSERYGFGAWFKATKDFASDANLQAAFEASGLATEYARSDMGAQLTSTTKNIIRTFGRKLFTHAEMINRRKAFTIAYKAAEEAGLNPLERSIAGILESDLTQFNMTRTGRLPMTRGGIGSVVFQFTPYRMEMLAHIGGEVKRLFIATRQRNRQQQYLAFKRLMRIMLAAHLVGGLDATLMGPIIRAWSEEDDAEFSGFWHALDAASIDHTLGMMTVGRPFEWGAKINPLNLLNRNLTGPLVTGLFDVVDWAKGAPMAPTVGHMIVSNLPGGVQLERTFGPEIEKYLTKPLFGPKQGKLRTVQTPAILPLSEEISQRVGGPKAKKGQRFTRG